VAIKTEEDLPDDYQDAIEEDYDQVTLFSDTEDEFVSGTGPDAGGVYTYTVQKTVTNTSSISGYAGKVMAPATGFRWVRIQDVKTAVESRGWKFLYQAMCYPVALTVYTLSHETLQAAPGGIHSYEYQGGFIFVGTILYGRASNFYNTKRVAWVDAVDGEWKQPAQDNLAVLADGEPADLLTSGYYVAGFDKWVIYNLSGIDADGRKAIGVVHPQIGDQRKAAVFQNVFSTGIENESVVFLVPVSWVTHAEPEYSLQGYDAAKLGWFAGAFQNNRTLAEHPLEVVVRSGVTAYAVMGAGETEIASQSGRYLELVPLIKTFVPAD
jgi:hypothetical protein